MAVGPRFSPARLTSLALALAAAWLLWSTPAMFPVRILVTFMHESGHALGAVLTGGDLVKITVDADSSGLCYTRGGWRWVTIPGGYLGSMAWGCLLLLLAARTRCDKFLSLSLGASLILLCLLYVRSSFGFWFGLAAGAGWAAAGVWLREEVNDFLLTFVGSASCLYALFDIRDLLLRNPGGNRSDAAAFSREILALPPAVWAALWGAAALACLLLTLRHALRRS